MSIELEKASEKAKSKPIDHDATNKQERANILNRLLRTNHKVKSWPMNPVRPQFSPTEPDATRGRSSNSAQSDLALFLSRLDKASSSDTILSHDTDIHTACRAYGASVNAKTFTLAPAVAKALPNLKGALQQDLSFFACPRTQSCALGVTIAYGGLCETGALLMLHNDTTPAAHLLLPDHVIVLVDYTKLFRYFEDIPINQLGSKYGTALSLVTGPSRSGDIEQTMILGAHGAKAIHVLMIESLGVSW